MKSLKQGLKRLTSNDIASAMFTKSAVSKLLMHLIVL